jgi:hypothetical protein
MKDGMTTWAKSHALAPKLAHDFKCTQYESKTMLKMMLGKKWLCNQCKMFFCG